MTLSIVTALPLPTHLTHATAIRQPENPVYLRYDERGLCLCKQGEKGVVQVDFASGAAQYRRIDCQSGAAYRAACGVGCNGRAGAR